MSAAKFLYILCEGERDEMFYERLCERITGQSHIQPQELRLRRNSGFKAAVTTARLLVNRFQHFSEPQDIAVIIAVDNDRAPGHPGSLPSTHPLPATDLRKSPRYPALVEMVAQTIGPDPAARMVDVALGVPVEMVETWLLMLINPECGELPLFSNISHDSRQYYGGRMPPPQLKELRDAEAGKLGLDLDTLFYNAADQGDLDRLGARSESFTLFRRDLLAWRGVGDRVS